MRQGAGGRRGGRPGSGSRRPAAEEIAAPVVAPVAPAGVVADPVSTSGRSDSSAFHRNRRRALAIAAAPGIVVFVVVAAVCVGAGLEVVGVIAGVGAGLVVWAAVWRSATDLVLRRLEVRAGGDAELARADNLVDGLCATMGLELPDIVVVDDDACQALALGRKSTAAVLVVTTGLLETLEPVPLEGVLAHELVHIKRGDVAPATMAAAVLLPVGAFAPVSGLVHSLAGRGREMRTDTLAVGVTRYPPGLRDALVLMAGGPSPAPSSPLARRAVARATRWLWTVPLPAEGEGDPSDEIGELDAPAARVAALDEG